MQDGKSSFYNSLNLDRDTRKIISWFRKSKPLIMEGKKVEIEVDKYAGKTDR